MTYEEKRKQIDELKNQLDSLLPMSVEDERRYWKKVRLDWNYNSNHIEGNTLTYGETELLLIFDQTSGSHELREYEEMKAHDVAIHMVKEWARDKSRDITESDIRELNRIILVKPYWKEAITNDGQPTRRQIKVGEYKEQPNSVRLQNGEIFEYAPPFETPAKMQELLNFYRANTVSTEVHPVWLAAMMHHKFTLIHPFDDGNGRVARLLMNYILMKNDFPPILIKSSEKKKYLEALRQADVGNDQFFEFYLYQQLERSLELAIKAASGESIEEPEDLDKEIKQIELSLKNQQAEVVKRNKQLVWNIWEKSIWPLSNLLYEKLIKFNSLFTEFETCIYKDSSGQVGDRKVHDQLLNEYFRIENVREITIEYRWRGFKGGDAKLLFDIHSELRIRLDDFDYTVNAERHHNEKMFIVKKLYSQQLTDLEMKAMVEEKAKKVLTEIREQYKRLTGKEL